MRMLFILILIVNFSNAHAQENNLVADYTYTIKHEILPSATTVNSRLTANAFESHYEMDFVGNLNFIEEEAGVDGGSALAVKVKQNPIIYKDNQSKYIYSIERIFLKPFLVKDSMNIFNWKINENKKEILGYSCQQATVHYRGRNYTAYFTTEIPFQTGPWKFYGLPGLILEAESDDGVLKLNINKIAINTTTTTTTDIVNPYLDIKLQPISWDEYIIEYEKKHEEFKGFRDPNGGTISIPKRIIETLISDKYLSENP
ncbi:GLPGLI family protein [Bizionia argentinensis JUB59]|uniref:GLPGLI family protein n=1 Tax=Bizionia argentinensis JUB59 TaxID=1046627 RepID=G2EC11_9FLAO|nr:GLPGLI family protein [Bizionia argentinensis]EGV44014.1 GLPGLI family protein [Bizionia argentinensis JUB59]